MPELQATWTPEGRLFFWVRRGDVTDPLRRELPALATSGEPSRKTLVLGIAADGAADRHEIDGIEYPVIDALPALATLDQHAAVSDSIQAWSAAAKLALELAAGQRVIPAVRDGRARWRALLSRPTDRDRLDAIARRLPWISRAIPTRDRPKQ